MFVVDSLGRLPVVDLATVPALNCYQRGIWYTGTKYVYTPVAPAASDVNRNGLLLTAAGAIRTVAAAHGTPMSTFVEGWPLTALGQVPIFVDEVPPATAVRNAGIAMDSDGVYVSTV